MLWTDLIEIKTLLGLDPGNTAQDAKLLLLNTVASEWLGEWLNRPGFDLKSRIEYYDGTGTQKLLLRSRPVYTSPTIQVYADNQGFWGAASGSFDTSTTELTYGTDFALMLDPGEEGKSRSGILVRINGYWERPMVRQRGLLSPFVGEGFGNVKVVYTAGYVVDTLPATLRMAANLLVARLNHVWPLGVELGSESYEERSLSYVNSERSKLFALVKPLIWPYRNLKW